MHDGVLKIGDFGFCKPLAKDQTTHTILGTPLYSAPEVLKEEPYTV